MDILNTQQLLERLATLLRGESRNLLFEYGLQPIQFEALHYLLICNRYSDTPMSVTEYLGQTKGSVSQTLKVLEKKGLIEKNADSSDKRVTHLAVTKQGRKLIKKILPSPLLSLASNFLDDQAIVRVNELLIALLKSAQQANGFKSFGQCDSCRHNTKLGKDDYFCGLVKEPLSKLDVELICREHEPDEPRKKGITGEI